MNATEDKPAQSAHTNKLSTIDFINVYIAATDYRRLLPIS